MHTPSFSPRARRQFETFSYLPPLTADQIAKQVDYIVSTRWRGVVCVCVPAVVSAVQCGLLCS